MLEETVGESLTPCYNIGKKIIIVFREAVVFLACISGKDILSSINNVIFISKYICPNLVNSLHLDSLVVKRIVYSK